MLDGVMRAIDQVQGIVFEDAVQPLLYTLGLMDWSEDLFNGVGVALFGALEIAFAYMLFRPLEWWRPVERWPNLLLVINSSAIKSQPLRPVRASRARGPPPNTRRRREAWAAVWRYDYAFRTSYGREPASRARGPEFSDFAVRRGSRQRICCGYFLIV